MAFPLESPGGDIPLAELRNAARELIGPGCNDQCALHSGGTFRDNPDCEPGPSKIHNFVATDDGIVGVAKKRARGA